MGWGWSEAHEDNHEKGHRNVADAFGFASQTWRDPATGELATYIKDANATPVQVAAMAYGGGARAGRQGCQRDDRIANKALRKLPRSERPAARREARRLARRHA